MFTWACLNFLYLENLDSIIMIFEINKNHPLFLTMDKNGLQIQWSWVLNNIKTYVCMCVLSRKSWGNKTLFFVNDLTCIKLVLSDIQEISKIARVVISWEFCEIQDEFLTVFQFRIVYRWELPNKFKLKTVFHEIIVWKSIKSVKMARFWNFFELLIYHRNYWRKIGFVISRFPQPYLRIPWNI